MAVIQQKGCDLKPSTQLIVFIPSLTVVIYSFSLLIVTSNLTQISVFYIDLDNKTHCAKSKHLQIKA